MAGKASPARLRYYRRLLGFIAVYAAIMAAIFLARSQGYAPQGPLRYLVAVLPALPICGVIWSILRFVVEEEDEYVRHLHIREVLIATGVTLCVCTAWGFLASFAAAPAPGLEYVFVIFNVAICLSEALTFWRER